MKRTPMIPDLAHYPALFHPLLGGSDVYDSSCSPGARVCFIDRGGGLFLKSAPTGSLKKEAELTGYFHQKGLAAEVLAYESAERDWLLTRRVAGEDCTTRMYLDDPKRLCDTTAHLLRQLHELPFGDCPVSDLTADYLAAAGRNYRAGTYDTSAFPDSFGYASAEEAWQVVQRDARFLKNDTLLHGDYCLPNIMLDNWRFTGFIDLGGAGVGDRHVDLFWGTWTLFFNLKTHQYFDRFLDAYGRDAVEPDLLRLIAAIEVFG